MGLVISNTTNYWGTGQIRRRPLGWLSWVVIFLVVTNDQTPGRQLGLNVSKYLPHPL